MANKILCDNCGSDGAFGVQFSFSTYQKGSKIVEPPKDFKGDLCPACFTRIGSIINAVLTVPSINLSLNR